MFSPSLFRDFLQQASREVTTHLFRDFDWQSPGLVLRHDIDLSIDYCLNLVEQEKEAGVRSTCFIMTTSDYYNPCSRNNSESLKKISDWGYEIGLHFDPTCYLEASNEEMLGKVNQEAAVLENIIGREVRSVSLHCPSVHGSFPMFDGYVNAYSSDFFSDENYISDSCKSFRGKNPFEWLKIATQRPIQMLLHPLHYQSESSHYKPIFSKYIDRHIELVNDQFSVNPTFAAEIGKMVSYTDLSGE